MFGVQCLVFSVEGFRYGMWGFVFRGSGMGLSDGRDLGHAKAPNVERTQVESRIQVPLRASRVSSRKKSLSLKHEPSSEPQGNSISMRYEPSSKSQGIFPVVPRRARIQGSKTFASLNSRLESERE